VCRSGTQVDRVWTLDLSDLESVRWFTSRIEDVLERLDTVVANAGVVMLLFDKSHGVEGFGKPIAVMSNLRFTPFSEIEGARRLVGVKPALAVVSFESYYTVRFFEARRATENQRNSSGELKTQIGGRRRADTVFRSYWKFRLSGMAVVRRMHARLIPHYQLPLFRIGLF
jgi:NAD(P)-dependent dehydrogenase (short-subunit alcohol dehydrogenase family)